MRGEPVEVDGGGGRRGSSHSQRRADLVVLLLAAEGLDELRDGGRALAAVHLEEQHPLVLEEEEVVLATGTTSPEITGGAYRCLGKGGTLVLTALGERVERVHSSHLVELVDFTDEQIRRGLPAAGRFGLRDCPCLARFARA